jgi:hypothetical protein
MEHYYKDSYQEKAKSTWAEIIPSALSATLPALTALLWNTDPL